MTPFYLMLCGASFILNGTILYWPSERLSDWLVRRESIPALKMMARKFMTVRVWIRRDMQNRLIYRAGIVTLGLTALVVGVLIR